MKILTNEMRGCRRGPEAWFTGTVWIDEVVAGAAPSRFKVNRVSFEPGARTAWHTHPMGQALHVLTGVGRVQLEGQAPRKIGPGDSVWIEAGERHWHGADAGHTMVHLAIQEADQNGAEVVWLEHVTEREYAVPDSQA
ncbi:MAG: cupin domain-containing protein [Acidobacteriota bacterium]|nr:cupin domain-containing protein [Acidobacteriota bacterium]